MPPSRLRFAPSPTGRLHVGGARTALFNWAYARGRGGRFLLRIEDTDRERSAPEHEAEILDGLAWLGIDWDEGPDVGGPHGPYRQSERGARYAERAAALLASGHAYRCFCTTARLEELRAEQAARKENQAYDRRCASIAPGEAARRAAAGEAAVLRFRVPDGETRFADRIRGEVVFRHSEVDDWVMVRSDGSPTYNFVVVCDDIDMAITHVLRGEEHLVNTPKQILLYRAFGEAPPEFGHLPLMLGTDRKKLSKRTGDTALLDYRDKGYPPEAMVNFLSLQGWALDGATEVFSVGELVARFDIGAVSKGGAIFDLDKLHWLAGEYIRRDSVEHLASACAPWVVRAGLMRAEEIEARGDWYRAVVAGVKDRLKLYADLPVQIAFLFAPDDGVPLAPEADAGARKHAGRIATLQAFLEWLRPRIERGVEPASLREHGREWVASRGLKMPELFQPLRCALTGQAGGPDLYEVMAWLGPERTIRRLEAGIRRLA